MVPRHSDTAVEVDPEHRQLFVSVVASLQEERLVQRSPRGKAVSNLLSHLQNMDETMQEDMSKWLMAALYVCIAEAKRKTLPSLAKAALCVSFNRLRGSEATSTTWTEYMRQVPPHLLEEHKLALQLIIDRLLKKAVQKEKELKESRSAAAQPVTQLSMLESNAIRYMAGFVSVKLLKGCMKVAKHPLLRLKRELFANVLRKMRADGQPGEPDTVDEYSSLWSELIDRGGLYHICDIVHNFFVQVELVTRQHLDIRTCAGRDVASTIRRQVLASSDTLERWEEIVAGDILPKYEKYTVELLVKVVNLWLTIRIHSFAKGWTAKFERKYKKGTRKTLQPEIEL